MAEGRSARTRALNEELHQYARRKDYANVMATLARGEQDKTVDGRTFAIAISACADAGDAAGAVGSGAGSIASGVGKLISNLL